MVYEYGAMSSKFSIEADNKLTAYAGMVIHFGNNARLIAIFSPENDETHNDSWLMYPDKLEKRLDEIFGGEEGCFFKYIEEHEDEIKQAVHTIKRLI